MKKELPEGRTVVATGNEAAAYAALLSRVQVIPAYPITPQTVVVERLAEMTAGDEHIIYKNMESEHAMLGYASRASKLGMRVFTATSSQGLLYADEQLHRIGRERIPMVIAIANRSVAAPLNLGPDLNDSMSKRDCGCLQFYCSNVQEILDTIILGFKVAEKVLLPAMINYEGFILSHAASGFEIPSQATVDRFLPAFSPPKEWIIDPDRPRSYSQIPAAPAYARFQLEVERAMNRAREVIEKEAREFSKIFGREKVGLLEITGNRNAKIGMVAVGSIGDTAKCLVKNNDLLLMRIHTFRPFPATELRRALKNVKKIAVIDRATSFGGTAPLAAEVIAAAGPRVRGFIAGIGGCNVTETTLENIIRKLDTAKPDRPTWIIEEN